MVGGTERLIRVGTRYLWVYYIWASCFLMFALGIGITELMTGRPRVQVPDSLEISLVVAVCGPHIVLIFGNALFVIAFLRGIAACRGRLRWSDGLLILGSLIPWVGWTLFRRLPDRLRTNDLPSSPHGKATSPIIESL